MCEPKDLQAAAQVRSPFTKLPTVFLYERHPGGVGLAEGLFAAHRPLLQAGLELAQSCPCKAGCPSCVGPGPDEATGGKSAAVGLLTRLLRNETV